MNKPVKLKKGDKVALIAPSGRVSAEKLQKSIENIISLGLEPVYNFSVKRNYKYFSGTLKERLDELYGAFADKNIKAVFAIRGGYGATELLPYINYDLIAENPKIFVGFSDITALHLAFLKKCNLPGFHGIVAASDFTDYVKKQITDLLINPSIPYKLPFKPKNSFFVIKNGIAEGPITGGNLSLLVSLIGTEYQPIFKNKIVFVEEIAEPPYKIDRMLEHLLQATDLSWASGIVLGTFNKCTPEDYQMSNEVSYSLREIFHEKFGNLGIPVIGGINFGHIRDGLLFPLGIKAYFDADRGEVILIENFKR